MAALTATQAPGAAYASHSRAAHAPIPATSARPAPTPQQLAAAIVAEFAKGAVKSLNDTLFLEDAYCEKNRLTPPQCSVLTCTRIDGSNYTLKVRKLELYKKVADPQLGQKIAALDNNRRYIYEKIAEASAGLLARQVTALLIGIEGDVRGVPSENIFSQVQLNDSSVFNKYVYEAYAQVSDKYATAILRGRS